jgi:hypothetical protein
LAITGSIAASVLFTIHKERADMASTANSTSSNMEDLARRVQRLEDMEEIKKLKAVYCAHCDDSYNPQALSDLFIEDGVWDGGEGFGRHVGREAIKAFFTAVSKDITFAAHTVLNPIIDVSGDRATGRWYIIMPATLKETQAMWLLGKYDEEYVRVRGKWMYKSLNANILFFSPYEKGWATQRFL